jgi:hypothetical protein
LRFASPRKGALGREVSDELTVPLCSFTHTKSTSETKLRGGSGRHSTPLAGFGSNRVGTHRQYDMIDAQKV